ncbi:50S ribosomal protein L32 [Enterococcus casseliflavus]|nr:50S ribosomal protein L32 [Enterococcus casseliflavus]MBE9908882.1 50S ribosomal protein L32 [Enterococcus casseliflavus]
MAVLARKVLKTMKSNRRTHQKLKSSGIHFDPVSGKCKKFHRVTLKEY